MSEMQREQIGHVTNMDYVKGGVIYGGAYTSMVMVESADDLENLPDTYAPGSIAFTAGYQDMWQLAADGTWVSVTGGENAQEDT